MPSKRIRSNAPSVGGGGGSVTVLDAFTDAFTLKIFFTETANATPTDADSYVINFNAGDDPNAGQSETVQLAFPAPDFADTSVVPTDADSFTMRVWLSASAGGTNPSNADGANNGTVATLQTAVAGAATISMTSTLGASLPTATVTSVVYRGWFKSVNTLVTSTGSLIMHSTTAAFADVTMFTNSGLSTTVDHLSGDFTFDLIAAGINTLAKLQSCQMIHRTTDAVAGVTPQVLTVDAGCLEVVGAFS